MPPKKRSKPSGAGGSQIEPAKLKVSELRTELENRGLETEGKKPELVARLEDALKAESAAPPKSKKIKVEDAAPPTATAGGGGGAVDYSKMKVSELKERLEAQGLDTTGKKAELVARLEAAGGGATAKTGVKKEAGAAKTAPKTKAPKKEPAASVKKEPAVKKEDPKEDEEPMEEETDFGKAKRMLEADASKKKGAPKQRKVDCGFPGRVVVDDWDCMLNQTNIGHNNNKYYVIQLLQCGQFYQLWTRWGRVGEPGQHEMKHFSALEEAQKAFKKKFSDKTKNKWENRDNFVPAAGKYTLIEMDEDGDDEEMIQKLEALDEPDSGPAPTVRPSTLDTPTQNLIKLIFNTDMFNHAMKSMEIDTKKMPLGKLSKAQIAKGFEALEAVEAALDKGASRKELAELTSKFYTIIPHSFGRTIPPVIDNKEMLQKRFDMLVVLGDIELAQGLQKDQEKKKKTEVVTEVPNPLDVQYESLKANLTSLGTSSEEYQVIVKYLRATEPQWRNLKLQHVWRVDRFKVDERFKAYDDIENRRLLWHGTNVAVVAAILKSGLRIMPHSGGRVGKGIYLASENSKSAGYVRCAADGTGIMFLNEAALGKEHHITMDDYRLTAPPPGFNSIIAKGRTEPDPKEDSSLTLDGKTVAVPQGKPKPTEHSSSNFTQSEYLVYKESQTRIRYMLQLKFH